MKKISIPNQSEKNRFRMIGKARINSIPKRNPKANTKLLEIEANGGGIEGEIVPNPLLTHRPRSESKRNLVGFSSNSLSSLAVLVFFFPFFFLIIFGASAFGCIHFVDEPLEYTMRWEGKIGISPLRRFQIVRVGKSWINLDRPINRLWRWWGELDGCHLEAWKRFAD